MNDIKDIKYTIQNEFINITSFDCIMKDHEQIYYTHDIRKGSKIIIDPRYKRRVWDMNKMFS